MTERDYQSVAELGVVSRYAYTHACCEAEGTHSQASARDDVPADLSEEHIRCVMSAICSRLERWKEVLSITRVVLQDGKL